MRELLLLARFGVVGLVNTGFGYVMFAGLLLLGVGSLAALLAATVASVAFNFQTSRRLVFRSPGRAWRFVGVYVAVLAINWSALQAAAAFGLPNLEAQAFLALPVAVASFIGQRLFVFDAATA